MSLPTAKVRLMKLLPALTLEAISSSPGRPCITVSIGSTISDSISCGEAARQPVWMDICGRSMSGNSCSGSLPRLIRPNAQTIATTTATAAGLRREASVSFIVQVRVVVGGAHDARSRKRRYGPEVMRGAALRRVVDAVRRTECLAAASCGSNAIVGAT